MSSSASKHYPAFRSTLPSMAGKTVAITGTTSGTGKVAATTLAGLGARLIVLNRASDRAATSFAELSGSHPDADLHPIECDLQSFSSVRDATALVADVCDDGIDVLCNNAGVMALPDVATADGFDVQMQTNHLSHFLLTRELFPLLKLAGDIRGEARIVNHSSIARMRPSKTLKAEYLEKNGGQLGGNGSKLQNLIFQGPRWLRYNQTKLANAAFTAALHHQLRELQSPVRALVAHPGLANTKLQEESMAEGGLAKVTKYLSQSAEDGAMGILSCSCLPHAQSGEFYGPGSGAIAIKGKAKPFDLEPFYDNPETRDLLWQKSEAAIGGPFELS